MQRIIATVFLILTLPLYPFLFLAIKLSSPGPFIFKQKRLGKNKIPFNIYKFRTMVLNADELKKRYQHLNEIADPLFKMANDPRYTWIGKIMTKIDIDELPQLINIIKGEMSFVGPRPFPIDEALKIPSKYDKRYKVKPGITGLWVVQGFRKLTLEEWMKLDLEYVKKGNPRYDISILVHTLILLVKSLF